MAGGYSIPSAHRTSPRTDTAIVSISGVLLHVLMDLPTPYGTRLFSPFDWHWYAIDLMPIIDVYLLAALAAGLVFVGRSGAARGRNATIVLTLMAANYGLRGFAHERALSLAPQVFGSGLPPRWMVGGGPIRSSTGGRARCLRHRLARPHIHVSWISRRCQRLPRRSTGGLVVQLSDGYEISDVNGSPAGACFRTDIGSSRRRVRLPNQWTPAVFAAAGTEVGRLFLGFSRFPAARAFVDSDGITTVRWNEMRFTRGEAGADQRNRREEFFTATVRIGGDGRIVDQRLGL